VRWEYRVLRLNPGNEPLWKNAGEEEVLNETGRKIIEDELNRRGDEGWELVHLQRWEFALFKRPRPDSP
jgi:hypothetical protein